MIQSDDAPQQIAWTTEEEIALAKGWVAISENSKYGNATTRKTANRNGQFSLQNSPNSLLSGVSNDISNVLMDPPDDVNMPDLGAENDDELGDEIGETVDNGDVVQIGKEEEFIIAEIGDEIVADIDKGDGVRKKRMSRPRGNGISIRENKDPSCGSDSDSDSQTDQENQMYMSGDSESEESLKSFDYLSEGEAEVIELRKRMTQFRSGGAEGEEEVEGSDNDQNDSFDDEGFITPKRMFDIGISDTVKEHEQDMNALMRRIKGKGCELKDPFTMVDKTMKYPIYDEATHWKLKKPKLGEKFVNVDQFKECECLRTNADGNLGISCGMRRSLQKIDYIAKCGLIEKNCEKMGMSVCPWRCYGKMLKGVNSFQAISLKDEHTCIRNYNYGTLINYKWLGKHFGDKIRANPHIRLLDIADLDHYGLLRFYAKEIADLNVGSIVKVGVTVNPDEKTYFDRFYVCLKGLKEGWKLGCRKIIALDGYDLDLPTGCGLTLISDQHKGLIEAVKEVMPYAKHRQFSECFNAVLVSVRHKPIITMLESMRVFLMERMHTMRLIMEKWTGEVCPKIQSILEHTKDQQRFWHVIPVGESKFEVRKVYDAFTVDEINLGRNWNTNKRGGKSGGTCFVKMRGGKSSRGRLVPTERLGRIGGWLGLDAATSDLIDPTEDRQPFQRSQVATNFNIMDAGTQQSQIDGVQARLKSNAGISHGLKKTLGVKLTRGKHSRSAFIGSTSSSPRVARQTIIEPATQE
ncbi:hypothetical protein Tco_1122773 [Tanacetum coccineum]|uniref:Transposase n=1 Tax=Tanacetum coccineum TaxID=301880 RepID=A0ABQ5J411_9ASTR